MDSIAIGLFILALGWRLFRDFKPTQYAAMNHQGHPQYFGAVLAAAYLLTLAIALHAAAQGGGFYRWAWESIAQLWPAGSASAKSSTRALLPLAAWSAVLAWLLPIVFNEPLQRNALLKREVRTRFGKVDDLDRAIRACTDLKISFAVTLVSGKVYVGVPLREHSEGERSWLVMLPLASGCRRKDGSLQLSTAYLPIYARIFKDQPVDDADADGQVNKFRVFIPVAQISSAQLFDLAIYESQFTARRQAGVASNAATDDAVDSSPLPVDTRGAASSGSGFDTDAAAPRDDYGDGDGERLPEDGLGTYHAFLLAISVAILALPFSFAASAILALLAMVARALLVDEADDV